MFKAKYLLDSLNFIIDLAEEHLWIYSVLFTLTSFVSVYLEEMSEKWTPDTDKFLWLIDICAAYAVFEDKFRVA